MAKKALDQMSLAELGDELNEVVVQSRTIFETAEKAGRTKETLLADEETQINKLVDQIEPIRVLQKKKQYFVNRISNLSDAELALNVKNDRLTPSQLESQQKLTKVTWNRNNYRALNREFNFTPKFGSPNYQTAFSSYLRGTPPEIAFNAGSVGMSVSDDERGGYFATSEVFATELLKNVDDAVYMQSLCRMLMMPAGAQNYGIRVRKNKASSFRWGEENRSMAGIYDTSLKYGKRVMTPNWLHGSCIISKELIRNFPGAESMVLGELAIDMSEVLEQAYLYGDGNQKPLGIMTPNEDGIGTDRDYESQRNGNFTFDDFINMKFELKPQYRGNATWMFHRYILRQVCLLKDGEGQYLWQVSKQVGEPDRILGLTFTESEWLPSSFVAGAYFCILGNFSYYYIIWDMMMQMQRLIEMRAHTNEYEYLFRCKVDGQPVLPEAFVRGVFGDTDV